MWSVTWPSKLSGVSSSGVSWGSKRSSTLDLVLKIPFRGSFIARVSRGRWWDHVDQSGSREMQWNHVESVVIDVWDVLHASLSPSIYIWSCGRGLPWGSRSHVTWKRRAAINQRRFSVNFTAFGHSRFHFLHSYCTRIDVDYLDLASRGVQVGV